MTQPQVADKPDYAIVTPEPGNEAAIKQAVNQFAVDGFLHSRDVYPMSLVEEMAAALQTEYLDRGVDWIRERSLEIGYANRFMLTVTLRPPFDRVLLNGSAWMQSCLELLLGPDLVLQSFGAVCALPGTGLQHVHSDHPQLFPELGKLSHMLPTYAITMVIPLCDITPENGGTAIWPVSHAVKELPRNNDDSEDLTGSHIVMPARTDCVIWDFRTRHCGLPNNSQQTRSYIYMTWCRTWFEDRQNFTSGIQVPLEIAEASFAAMDEKTRKMLPGASIV
jgi:hypothetical protein